jgi:hypothetical protein
MNVFRSTLILLSFIVLASCHGDTEDEATSVQYRVIAEDSLLTEVTYRSADEMTITLDSLIHLDMWHTTEFVDSDFDAHLKVRLVNTDNIDKPYKLSCFVEGNLVSVKEGIIAPLTEKTEEINYSVQD